MAEELKVLTIEELAEDAFLKREVYKAQMMRNVPLDFEEAKRGFVELAKARDAAAKAMRALNDRIGDWPEGEQRLR